MYQMPAQVTQSTQASGAEAVPAPADQELCRGDKHKRSSASMHKKG